MNTGFHRFDKELANVIDCAVLAAMKQIMPSKAADNSDLLAAVLSLCGDVYVGLAHCVETGLQAHADQLTHWPQETADIADLITDESVTSGNFWQHNFAFNITLHKRLRCASDCRFSES